MKTIEGKRCACGHVVEGHKKRGCRGEACTCKTFRPVQLTVDAEFERLVRILIPLVDLDSGARHVALHALDAYAEAKSLYLPHVGGRS